MTPAALRSALVALCWSQRDLASVLGCSDALVREWTSGRAPVPPAVAAWLQARAASAEAIPPPVDFRRRAGRPRRAQVVAPPSPG